MTQGRGQSCPFESPICANNRVAGDFGEGDKPSQKSPLGTKLEAACPLKLHVSIEILAQHGSSPGQG